MARTRKGTRPGHGKRPTKAASGSPKRTAAAAGRNWAGPVVGERAARPAPTAVNGFRRAGTDTVIPETYIDLLAPRDEAPAEGDYQRRVAVIDTSWGRSLRFARSTTWALPLGALGLALAGVRGWPGSAAPPSAAWLLTMLASLVLALVGGVALTALLGGTPGRRWAAVALVLMLAGTVLFVPVLGLIAVARGAAGDADGLARTLASGGLGLLGSGWVLMGCGVLVARILNRADGVLLVLAVGVAMASAYLSWQFLFVVAAMIMVAGGLGLSWSAWRLTPDGRVTD